VRPGLVVVDDEPIDLRLELFDRTCRRLLREPALERLVEALDLPAGLRVIGARVPKVDPQGEELGLQHVRPAAVPGRVDAPVVREQRRRESPSLTCRNEHREGLRRARAVGHVGGDTHARVVVDHVDDLDLGPVGQAPVRHVGLPALVRQVRLERAPGALRPLVRLGHDEATPTEHSPDRRDRRHVAATPLKVGVDRLGAGVDAELAQLLAKGDDLILQRGRCAVGDRLGRRRPRCDRLVAAGAEPLHEFAHVALGHPVGVGDLPVAAALEDDRAHHVACQIHRRPPHRCPRCSDTCVHYLVNSGTLTRSTLTRRVALMREGAAEPSDIDR
jgi:hypothetical protein